MILLLKEALCEILVSCWALIRLKIERNMKHCRNKLIFLFTVTSLPVWNTDRRAYFI